MPEPNNERSSSDRARSDRLTRSAPWVVWLIGLCCAFYPALLSGFADVQLRLGDPRLVHYILEHSWQWLAGHPLHAEFWNPPVYWPAENGSALSDVMLGAGPLYWLARWTGAESGLAMQLWMMASFSLNYLAAYVLLRRGAETGSLASSIGAFLFGFGSSRLANFNSPQLFVLYWGLFALTAVVLALRALETQRVGAARGWIVAAAACAALQVWSAFYPAFFLAASAGVALLVALALPTLRPRLTTLVRELPLTLLACALATAAAVYPLAAAHLAVAEQTGLRPWAEVQPGLPTWASWIYQGRTSLLYGGLAGSDAFSFQSAESQHSNGVGILTAFFALAGLLTTRRAGARLLGITTALMLLAAMRFGDVSAWRLVYDYVPGGGAVRYVARLGIYLALPAAFGVAWILDRPALRQRAGLVVLIGALFAAEQLHRLTARSDADYRAAVESIADRVDPQFAAFFVSTEPVPSAATPARASLFQRQVRARRTQVLLMWVATQAGIPTVNGFYGLDPAGWRTVDPFVQNAQQRQRVESELTRWLHQNEVSTEDVQRLSIPTSALPWN